MEYEGFAKYYPNCFHTGKPTSVRLARRSDGCLLVVVFRVADNYDVHAHPADMREIFEYGDTLIGVPYPLPTFRIRSRKRL